MANSHVGVDVGGTFTDVFLVDADGRRTGSVKSPTTRPDPTLGIVAGLERLHRAADLGWGDVASVTVGSTLALNAVIEERGARTALITTRGFRDVLEIGRESRERLYDLQHVPQDAIIPRDLRYEITERVTASGEAIARIDLSREGPRLLDFLERAEVEALAICFLNSFVNPKHEEELRDYVAARRPELFVSASVDVHRQYREYERTLLTCMNAYVGPIMTDYLAKLEGGIRAMAPDAVVRVTDSVGGAMNLRAAGRRPVLTMMSGPASGVMGAVRAAGGKGDEGARHSLVTMDMGGTSCDVAVVERGHPEIAPGVTVGPYNFALSSVDVHSIGAGGGTVAWVDDGGLLRVGPESTGSMPGPACYGRGGELPTVTDAHLVLGHLQPDVALGGEIQLDLDAANRAIETYVGRPLGLSVHEAASGIIRIADASMLRAIESMTVQRGLDPRTCDLVAYGGAAPLHAAGIAKSLGIVNVVVPKFAGVLSAMGAVWAPEHYEAARTCLRQTRSLDQAEVDLTLKELERTALALADVQADRRLVRSVYFDMRFVGQTSHLRINVGDIDSPDSLERAHNLFVERYGKVFGYVLPDAESEVENIRVRMTVVDDRTALAANDPINDGVGPTSWRAAFDGPDFTDCQLYDLSSHFSRAAQIFGPAVVVGPGTTVLVRDRQIASFDAVGNLIIETPADLDDPRPSA